MNLTVIIIIAVPAIVGFYIVRLFCEGYFKKLGELFADDSYNALKKKVSRRKRNNKAIKVKKISLNKRKSTLELEIVEIEFTT